MVSSEWKSGTRTPSSMIIGASSSTKLDRPRRLMLCGRPFRSSCIVSIGASWRRTCHALCAPDLSICSAVIRNVPGGCGMLSLCLAATPHPSSEASIDAVSAFMRGLPVRGRRPVQLQPYTHVSPRERQGIANARARVSSRAMLQLTALLLVAQVQVPPPRGYVNDFAGVLDSTSVAHMEAVIAEVRAKTRGEIAVVTLPDIDDRPAADVALEIGRRWGVGAKGEAGDPAKNLGVVVLLVPLKNHRPGTGQIFIATGRGAEGFLTDARVGRIRDAMTPYLAREEYGAGLAYGVDLIAQAFAQEFGVTLDAAPPGARPVERDVSFPSRAVLFWLIFAVVFTLAQLARRRGRRGRRIWWVGGGWGGGGWGGGWGGGGGGGGGGFGGVGGGGGVFGRGAGGGLLYWPRNHRRANLAGGGA